MRGKPLSYYSVTLRPIDRPGTLVTRVRASCPRTARTKALDQAGTWHDWKVVQVLLVTPNT